MNLKYFYEVNDMKNSKANKSYSQKVRLYKRRARNRKNAFIIVIIAVAVIAIAICAKVLVKNSTANAIESPSAETTPTLPGSSNTADIPSIPQTQTLAQEVATETPAQSEHEDEVIPQIYEGEFELPLRGATVYTLTNTNLNDESGAVKSVSAGTSLQIISEENGKLTVKTDDGFTGIINSYECMLNLPDVIPSIVYMDTNSSKSLMMSSGYEIPNVTGKQLYDVEQYNQRLGRTEFNMPIIFETAKKVMAVQKSALSEGYSLCIVETYRPLDTQQTISSNLKILASSEPAVSNGIVGNGWSESWFIAQSISNHQRGYALDVTLVKVNETEICTSGNYAYVNVSKYDEVQMPTQIHELSDASIALAYGVKSSSTTAWKDVPLASSMNDVAIRLQNYCVSAGFTPLASEWWHFNDLDARNSTSGSLSNGEYFLQTNLSVIPE